MELLLCTMLSVTDPMRIDMASATMKLSLGEADVSQRTPKVKASFQSWARRSNVKRQSRTPVRMWLQCERQQVFLPRKEHLS